MEVHLIDGTYELFRQFFGVPSSQTDDGREIGAVRGVLTSLALLLEGTAGTAGRGGTSGTAGTSQKPGGRPGATHVAVATDHVITSFRNDLWAGYKDGSEMEPAIAEQFGPLEEALAAMGLCVWPMVEFEADDALAAGAAMAAADKSVSRVLICTPDKDLAQCVSPTSGDGTANKKVFQWDRRKDVLFDAAAVKEKFGVWPPSIPDYLALVGDTADGFPGLPGWGAKSAATVLSHYGQLDAIPAAASDWQVQVRGSAKLATTLADNRELALLFREIATVRTDAPVANSVDELRWQGPQPGFAAICKQMRADALLARVEALAQSRS